jgi:methyl-accepting chemotaxis protein
MDETTQQNAALVEEAAAAAESLVDQANQLADAISQFKLEGRIGGGVTHVSLSGFKPQASSAVARPTGGGTGASSRTRPPSKPPLEKRPVYAGQISRRTGTDDSDWEEF